MSARDVIAAALSVPGPMNRDAEADAILSALHAAGYMIVPRKPTAAMVTAAISRPEYGASTTLFYGDIYAAMTTEGELK